MSNSVFVPVSRLPLSLDEARIAVDRTFEGFGLIPPEMQLHEPENLSKIFPNPIVLVRGKREHEHRCVSFGKYPAELSGTDNTTQMGAVTTRGS
ncbi:hypothetical protein [Andreprevotia sp. IGB-42]|uniref:hypothetical protein n=1 Tax=Andreprevotia sp. IGB-42 TaxID=2497473 RepID=UPI001356FE98|nr:hypothetical protein [Andreprevotia sp. IGB-42]